MANPHTPEWLKANFEKYYTVVQRSYLTPCWECNCPDKTRGGYGRVYFENGQMGIHNFAFTTFIGPIPDGHEVCHHCDNKPCCRPDHLYSAPHLTNIHDAYKRNLIPALKGSLNGLAKLTEADIPIIRAMHGPGVFGYQRIANIFGVDMALIYRIVKRKVWKHVP